MDETRNSTADVPLLSEEELKSHNPLRRSNKARQWRHISHGLFETILIVTIGVLMTALFFVESGRPQVKVATVVPQFTQVKKFWDWEPDRSFVHPEMFGNPDLRDRIMKDWLSRLVPLPSRGFIDIPNPEHHDLPPPRRFEPGENKYMITVFHQLHCLSHLIRAFSAARLGDDTFPFDDNHLAHCFDYIRQGLLCAADSTLEGNNTMTDGAHHVCNNFNALKDWAADNAASKIPQKLFIG
ncbi:hypothetical protein PFICI_00026 [Pestalotiopsis fici W106-1]|uniref:Oxidase ustYa n=1 Tax=Pestalotiopsis fici (strain W106-1 / CGMCC3.15140) TaxID=1229662 RepID=W3XJH2_PESFW|nr:uncharacterized protein PFICI_00026 [Pestalotiopsis fici W106-1]ETS86198.1 hypothetical protein PFICI_00026 [Pestalotiopsis fici W106-1]